MGVVLSFADLIQRWPVRQFASMFLLVVVVIVALGLRRSGGRELRPHGPMLLAVALGLLWVLAIGLVPSFSGGWLVVATTMILLFAAWRADRLEPPASAPPALVRPAIASVLTTTSLLALRVVSGGGQLMHWEPEVIEGFWRVEADPGWLWNLTVGTMGWGHGLVSSSWDSLLYGPPTAALMVVFGPSSAILRVVPAIFLLVSLVLLGLLGRLVGGPAVGWLAVATGSVSPALALYGGYGVSLTATLAAVLAASIAAVVMLASPVPRPCHGLLVGLTLALATFGYAPGRVVVLAVLAFVLVSLAVRRRTIGSRRFVAASIAVVILAAVGFGEIEAGRGEYLLGGRGEQLFTVKKHNAGPLIPELAGADSRLDMAVSMVESTLPQMIWVLGSPFDPDLSSERIVVDDPPMVPYVFAPLFPFVIWGFTVSLRRIRSAPHGILMVLLLASTAPILLTTRADAHRMIFASIPITLWAAIGLAEAATFARRVRVGAGALTAVGTACLVLGLAHSTVLLLHRPDADERVLVDNLIEQYELDPAPVTVILANHHGALGEIRMYDLGLRISGAEARLEGHASSVVNPRMLRPGRTPEPLLRRMSVGAWNGVLLLGPADPWQETAEFFGRRGYLVERTGRGPMAVWAIRSANARR